ncbi:YceH family protein [Aliagarivorans taiwanensis]|uniref:YceH family protein n=1 Tax=Aliagarivorans taiwanensis TaxID=561966 RepID=UPI000420C000|nr:YceH family protein [Aliagarivorans taiwanensis]
MNKQLRELEARVIGVLLEKETTTPDQYPLSVNALTVGCNQKSNREPVLELSEAEVLDTLHGLLEKRLVQEAPQSGRVVRYQQRFCNSTFGGLQLSEQQRAVITLLLLRGPQTPGELRSRSGRLAEFASVAELESCLSSLQQFESGPLVERLERQAGKRESRYAELFTEGSGDAPAAAEASSQPSSLEDAGEVARMRTELELLAEKVAELTARLDKAGL